MISSDNILFLGPTALGERLTDGLSEARGARLKSCTEPYDALLEMGRRRWPVVLLTTPRPDFPALCRASRRLQSDSRIVALCSAASEPQVTGLVGGALDDYFITPPTSDEIKRISAFAAGLAPGHRPDAATTLDPRLLASLADCARSIDDLENATAEVVSQYLGQKATWTDADQTGPQSRVVLFTAGAKPRVLVTVPGGPDAQKDQFLSVLQQCMPSLLSMARRTQSLHRLAITDNLTGTYNRRYFYHLVDRILKQAAEEGHGATLLLYDIDDFKHYNDNYGYAAGDEILRETAMLMKRITREQDVVARIGGDEFAVLFWDPGEPRTQGSIPPATAYALADRFRKVVMAHTFGSLGPEATGSLTISGGLASFPADGNTCRELLSRADKAIKAAKLSGKNGIQIVG